MLKNIVTLAFSRGIGGLAQAIILVILVRALGPNEFGFFTLVSTIAGFAAVVSGIGLNTLALRIDSKPDPPSWGNQIIRLRNLTMYFTVALIFAFVYLLHLGSLSVASAALLFSVFEVTSGTVESVLFGLRRVSAGQQHLILRRLVVLAVVGSGYFAGGNFLVVFHVAMSLGIVSSVFWTRSIWGGSVPMGTVIRESAHYWAPSVLTTLSSLDIVIARGAMSPSAFGTLAASTRIVNTLQVLPSSLLAIFTPELTATGDHRVRYRVAGRFMKYLTYGALAVALLSPVGGKVTELIVGPDYEHVMPVATILIWAFALDCLVQGLMAYFYAAGKPKVVTWSSGVGVLIGLVIILVLSLQFGPVGAATGVVIMRLIRAIWLASSFRRERFVGNLDDGSAL